MPDKYPNRIPMAKEKLRKENAEKDSGRLEAFSDGVFAIAITLLGLEMKVPSETAAGESGLGSALLAQWPVYTSFLTSFFIILVIWRAHHELFKLVTGVNRALFFANGLLLCAVTVIPFTTELVAEYIDTTNSNIAAMVYTLVSFPVGFGFVSLLQVLIHFPAIRKQGVEVKRLRAWNRRMWTTSILFVAGFLLSFISPHVSLGIILAAALYWSLAKTY